MNNKLFLGISLILIGMFSLFGSLLPDTALKYIFNWQIMIILMGVYFLLKKGINNVAGIALIATGSYFYIEKFLPLPYTNITLPIILIIIGVVIIVLHYKDSSNDK
ncbi:LiaF transmembrane domain-containing protein [Oceanivirga salmonicida]|uniref:LiaF transmembrane domain-containing protein n=1 Tax=Oceanivirga salmonicida TaxID=1769291 RepID=UPI0012E29E98|nr:hypothetical protein [Oceanivirga salmonicida]